jgi:hypothetical protein
MDKYVNKVDPDLLADWLMVNKEEVHNKSLECAIYLLKNPKEPKCTLIEFFWDDEIYSTIYMKRSDIPTSMKKSIEYFVSCEAYEKAQEAKLIIEKYESLNRK